jgi:hypothetical protein
MVFEALAIAASISSLVKAVHTSSVVCELQAMSIIASENKGK